MGVKKQKTSYSILIGVFMSVINVDRCSPVAMRDNLKIVNLYKMTGVDFVAVPVYNESDKFELQQDVLERLDKIHEESNRQKPNTSFIY